MKCFQSKLFLKIIVILTILLSLNYVFSTRIHVTFNLGHMPKQQFDQVVKNLNTQYLDSNYVNEGYLAYINNDYQITVRGWDSLKLLRSGYEIVDVSFGLF